MGEFHEEEKTGDEIGDVQDDVIEQMIDFLIEKYELE